MTALVSPFTGFLLTRHSRDRRGHTEIEIWVATSSGPAQLLINNEAPLFFIAASDVARAQTILIAQGIQVTFTERGFQDFAHAPHHVCYCSSIDDFYRTQRLLQEQGIAVLEGDIRLHERFLMERFARGGVWVKGDIQRKNGYWQVRNVQLKAADFRPNLKTLSLDVECSRHGELFSIGLYGDDEQGQRIARVLMRGDDNTNATEDAPSIDIQWFADERALLQAFGRQLQQLDPDVIIGWNVVNFDFQLLLRRAQRCHVEPTWARAQQLTRWKERQDKHSGFAIIPGRVIIDGIDALKNATYSFSRFSLEHVARELLGRGKLSDDPDHRLAKIEHDFIHDKHALARYNLEDCRLVWDIFQHTQLLDFLCLRSQLTGHELDRSGGSVAAFTNVYLPKLHRAGYVAPNLPAGGGLASPGGYVMESHPGLYRNVLVLDFKSLYPSIIRTFRIDPLGLIEGLAAPEQAIPGFRGAMFSRDHHFLPEIIDQLWQQRDTAKRHNDAPRSQAIKILMNSFYGVLGSGGCRFYDTRLASSITLRGQEIMQQTARWIEQQGWQVIYGDTDSTFVWVGDDMSYDQADAIGQQLADEINQRWQHHLQQSLQLESLLEIEYETLYRRFYMPTIRGTDAGSKKRYAGLQGQGEHEKLVFKGLETVRSDWTELAHQFQISLFQYIFHDRDPSEMIRDIVAQTQAGQFDGQLVYSKRLRRDLADYQKNVPPHVRAARLADQHNAAAGRRQRYQHGGWIRYLITTQGPEPVEYQEHPIDHQHYIDKQLRPICEAVLPLLGLDFDQLLSQQIGLF